MSHQPQVRVLFVTGTDTGVGKTVLTGLLLAHLRREGCPALAVKPFCSGGRQDATLLNAIQNQALALDDVNPWYFPEPIAPMVAARRHRRSISIGAVVKHLRRIAAILDTLRPGRAGGRGRGGPQRVHPMPVLLIEGAGGLLAPLGEGFSAAEIIRALRCETIVVARNRLGTINHTLLTVQALRRLGVNEHDYSMKVILMNQAVTDFSSRTNALVLPGLLAPSPMFVMPFLARGCRRVSRVESHAKAQRKLLARILG